MIRLRVRIRFCKEGDLRWISHRDLMRTFERLFRRAGCVLAMSQGYHPHPRMSFPLALSVGIRGAEEVMEVQLAEQVDSADLVRRLAAHAPPGLLFTGASVLQDGQPKARVEYVQYEIPVPSDRHAPLSNAIEQLMSKPSYPVERAGHKGPLDLLANLQELRLTDGRLRMRMQIIATRSAGPRDLLQALGMSDLEGEGHTLVRTAVEIAS